MFLDNKGLVTSVLIDAHYHLWGLIVCFDNIRSLTHGAHVTHFPDTSVCKVPPLSCCEFRKVIYSLRLMIYWGYAAQNREATGEDWSGGNKLHDINALIDIWKPNWSNNYTLRHLSMYLRQYQNQGTNAVPDRNTSNVVQTPFIMCLNVRCLKTLNCVSSLVVQCWCQHMVKSGHMFNEAGPQSERESLCSLNPGKKKLFLMYSNCDLWLINAKWEQSTAAVKLQTTWRCSAWTALLSHCFSLVSVLSRCSFMPAERLRGRLRCHNKLLLVVCRL